jgi:L-ascorbate metabolism protein UlaG (beta-lactamase superfamily)
MACGPRIFVPLGLKRWFDARAIPNVTERDWWEQVDVTFDASGLALAQPLRIHCTSAQHWSRRTPFDTNASLWGGSMVERRPRAPDAWRFLFPGDTGFSADFKATRARLCAVDFLALPIGAYLPPRDLAAALQARGLAHDRVWLLRHGETRAISAMPDRG